MPRATAALTGLGLVALLGFRDGGYFSHTWLPAGVALACLGAIVLVLGGRPELGRAEIALVGLLAAFAGWVALSALWSLDPDESLVEASRALLYVVGTATLLLVARRGTVAFLVGGAVAGIAGVTAYALADRAVEPGAPPVDPFEGTLLFEPVGYANALAILAVVGELLALGLLLVATDRRARAAAAAVSPLFLAALTLTGSNGAWLALAVGLGLFLALERSRRRLVAALLVLGPCAGSAAVLADDVGDTALVLLCVLAGIVAAVGSLLVDHVGRAPAPIFAAVALVALVVAGVAAWRVAPSPSSLAGNDRPHYWRVAVDQYEEHRALGSGAGTFVLFWLTERTVEHDARDAHNLYLETLAELGPVGLALLVAALVVPLTAVRDRPRSLVPAALAAYGAFLVHAGVDWDWEMPVVTLTGLLCASAALAASRLDRS